MNFLDSMLGLSKDQDIIQVNNMQTLAMVRNSMDLVSEMKCLGAIDSL